MRYYTGVGSRETPKNVQELMQAIGKKLAESGRILRSGGADGADQAFELGWLDWYANSSPWPENPKVEIYIPWDGFNKHGRDGLFGGVKVLSDYPREIRVEAEDIASEIHPAWDRLSQGAKKLHTRNVFQVLGEDLKTPSEFLICYAEVDKHGIPKGGTRTAWQIATNNGVRCTNLLYEDQRKLAETWLVG